MKVKVHTLWSAAARLLTACHVGICFRKSTNIALRSSSVAHAAFYDLIVRPSFTRPWRTGYVIGYFGLLNGLFMPKLCRLPDYFNLLSTYCLIVTILAWSITLWVDALFCIIFCQDSGMWHCADPVRLRKCNERPQRLGPLSFRSTTAICLHSHLLFGALWQPQTNSERAPLTLLNCEIRLACCEPLITPFTLQNK